SHEALRYNTRFSFTPYLNTIQKKVNVGCGMTKAAFYPVIRSYAKMAERKNFKLESQINEPAFQSVLSLLLPSMLFSNEMNFIAPPFSKLFITTSEKLQGFLQSDSWVIKESDFQIIRDSTMAQRKAYQFILQK